LEERLGEKASEALALSEVITIPGTYAGMGVAKLLGADNYTAAVIGGAVGNYIAGVLSYTAGYIALTRRERGYSVKKAFIDSIKVGKDCFPTALALYLAEAPIISGLLALGMPRNQAVGLNLVLGMTAFLGVAKYSASQNIKLK